MNSYTAVIPVHNGERTILEALTSLAKQTIEPKEIVIFDNNSTDRTLIEVEKFKKISKIPLRVERSDILLPPHKSFSRSIENVQGRFCWLAADDMLFPWSAEKVLSARCSKDCQHSLGGSTLFLNNEAELIYGKVYDRGLNYVKFLRDPADNSLFYGMHVASIVREYFPENSYPAWDWAFSFQCVRNGIHFYGPLPTLFREYTPMSSHRTNVLNQKSIKKYLPYISLTKSLLALTNMKEKTGIIIALAILNIKGYLLFGKHAPLFEKREIYSKLIRIKGSIRFPFAWAKKNSALRAIYSVFPRSIKNMVRKSESHSRNRIYTPTTDMTRLVEENGAKYRGRLLSLNNGITNLSFILGPKFTTAETCELIRCYLIFAKKQSKLVLDLRNAHLNLDYINTVVIGLKRIYPNGLIEFASVKNKEGFCSNIENFYGKVWANDFYQDIDSTFHKNRIGKFGKKIRVDFFLSEVPVPNRDAGSIDIIYILTLLKRMGVKVKVYLPHLYGGNQIALNLLNEVAEVDEIGNFKTGEGFIFVYGPYAYQIFERFSLENKYNYIMVDAVFRRAEQSERDLSQADKHIIYFENSALQNCKYALCISESDQEAVAEKFPTVKTIHFPIIRFPRARAMKKVGSQVKLLFIGSLNHTPNKVAADWLVEKLAPRLRSVNSKIELVLVGLGSEAYDQYGSNVRGLGMVTNLNELYAASFATIAPMNVAAGINGKVIESLSFGLPAIISEAVSKNLPAEILGNCVIARDLDEYAFIANEMFNNSETYAKGKYQLENLNGSSNIKTISKLLRESRIAP